MDLKPRLTGIILVGLLATTTLRAATPASDPPLLPTLLIEAVKISDPRTYASLVQQINTRMRGTHAVPLFLRAYVSTTIPPGDGGAFLLCPSASMETLLRNRELFSTHDDFTALRKQLEPSRAGGAGTYLKAVRFDGTNNPGCLFNSCVATNREASILERIGELERLLEKREVGKPMINVFRVVSSAATYTHLVSINSPSLAQLTKVRAAIAAESWSLERDETPGAHGKVIGAGVFQELVP
jgi:hypothetical protein